MPYSSQIINEMLPEIHTVEKCYFLKPIILSQMIYFSVLYEMEEKVKVISVQIILPFIFD